MKKILSAFIGAALLLSGCTKQDNQPVKEDTVETEGSWKMNEDETIANMPENVQNAFDKAIKEYEGMAFTPIAYLGSQVVAGTNYKVLCKGSVVTENPTTKLVTITIYEDLDGNCSISEVNDFDIENLTDEPTEEGLAGGWQVAEEYKVVNLKADAQKAFDQALQDLEGVNYEPLALLATQVVAGVNYAILCHTTTLSKEAQAGLAVITIYMDLDENVKVLSISQLNLANM